ncbi:hypothetical protein C8F01DRAFT_1127523, partial [Mycena amicta]
MYTGRWMPPATPARRPTCLASTCTESIICSAAPLHGSIFCNQHEWLTSWAFHGAHISFEERRGHGLMNLCSGFNAGNGTKSSRKYQLCNNRISGSGRWGYCYRHTQQRIVVNRKAPSPVNGQAYQVWVRLKERAAEYVLLVSGCERPPKRVEEPSSQDEASAAQSPEEDEAEKEKLRGLDRERQRAEEARKEEERFARLEQERAEMRERERQERQRRDWEEKQRKEQEERDRKAREEQRKAQEEKERKARAERQRRAQEEFERQERERKAREERQKREQQQRNEYTRPSARQTNTQQNDAVVLQRLLDKSAFFDASSTSFSAQHPNTFSRIPWPIVPPLGDALVEPRDVNAENVRAFCHLLARLQLGGMKTSREVDMILKRIARRFHPDRFNDKRVVVSTIRDLGERAAVLQAADVVVKTVNHYRDA